MEEGQVIGKIEGKREEKLEIARKMKRKGFPLETILEIARLSGGEILDL